MADLGTIGTNGQKAEQASILIVQRINVGSVTYSFAEKSIIEGDPAQPSLMLDRPGIFEFSWPVQSGSRQIAINVKQVANTSPRPKLTVLKDASIGVASDNSASAASGVGWVTIGPVIVTPSSNGVLRVKLENFHFASYSPCFWDNIIVA